MDAGTAGIWAELSGLEESDSFVRRHIGPSAADVAAMLRSVGAATLDDLSAKAADLDDMLKLTPQHHEYLDGLQKFIRKERIVG